MFGAGKIDKLPFAFPAAFALLLLSLVAVDDGFCLGPQVSASSDIFKYAFKEKAGKFKSGSSSMHPVELSEESGFKAEPLEYHPVLLKQLGSRTFEYGPWLLKRKSDGALFFLKIRHQPIRKNSSVWVLKNDPLRETAAFALGRYIDANVCDIILPDEAESKRLASYVGGLPDDIYLVRVANDYKLGDGEVMQKEKKKAFTRNLVLALLIRKYDFLKSNHAPVLDSDVPMMFDNDQGFNEQLVGFDMYLFTSVFVEHFFQVPRYKPIYARSLLDFIDIREMVYTVRFIENELKIDKVLGIVQIDDTGKKMQVREYLAFAKERAITLREDMLGFFDELAGFNLAYEFGTDDYIDAHEQFRRIRQALSEREPRIVKKAGEFESKDVFLDRSI